MEVILAQPPLSAKRSTGAVVPGQARPTFFVTTRGESEPRPSVQVIRVEGMGVPTWKIELDPNGASLTSLPGLHDQAVDLPSPRIHRAAKRRSLASLDGYRPAGLGVSFSPQVRRQKSRNTHESRGRRYRPLYIFPPDDRVVLTDTSYPWLAIGKIITSDGTSGSGALVGARTMLTARHVRPDRSIAAGNWWIKFTPHAFDGSEPFGSSFVSDNHYYAMTGDGDVDAAHDFMVCRLYEPLGNALGTFGMQEYTEDWNDKGVWASVGYPDDVAGGQEPVVQLSCSMEDSEEYGGGQVMETEADLNHGQSGGPFWAWFTKSDGGQTPRIVGVVSGEFDFGTSIGPITIHDHDNGVAGGGNMVDLINWARANWT
jgi:hypothetical protein